jgi:hypothetical protein
MIRKSLAIAAIVVALILVIQSGWPHVFAWAFLKPIGQITEHTLPVAVFRFPDRGTTLPTAYNLSPDGSQIALFYIDQTSHYMFLDSRTGATTGTLSAPPLTVITSPQTVALTPFPAPAYCDHGKYFYAPFSMGSVGFYDAHSLKLLQSFSLDQMLLENQQFPYADHRSFRSPQVVFQCASNTPISVFIFIDAKGYQVRIFDLDKMRIVGAITYQQNPLQFQPMGFGTPGATSFSSDGSLLALQSESEDGWPPDSNVSIVDVTTGRVLHTTIFKEGGAFFWDLAFAGNDALVIGEWFRCQTYDDVCNQKPAHRKLKVWNFGTDGSVASLGNFGMETYSSFGTSGDGSRIFSYAGLESWCIHCDWWGGNLRIKDARFVVWDRKSGNLIYRSPPVPTYRYTCPLIPFTIMGGGCYSSPAAPNIAMSADGNAVMAYWNYGSQESAPEEFKDEIQIFELR